VFQISVSVKKLKISGNVKNRCKSLHISLDFRQLSFPLNQLSIEDIDSVKLNDLIVRQNDTLNISFTRITTSLVITGEMVCPECSPKENKDMSSFQNQPHLTTSKLNFENPTNSHTLLKYPKVNIQILQTGNVSFENFVSEMGDRSDTRIKLRDAESVIIKDSYFNNLPSNGFEIFNVPNVTIFHSEFYHGSTNSIVLNGGVRNVHVKDCLMDKRLILPLDQNSTDIYFRCTTSPDAFTSNSGTIYLQEDPECVSNLSKWIGSNPAGVEATGAVVLALISALLLIIAIGFLFLLHRTGRLDQYM